MIARLLVLLATWNIAVATGILFLIAHPIVRNKPWTRITATVLSVPISIAIGATLANPHHLPAASLIPSKESTGHID